MDRALDYVEMTGPDRRIDTSGYFDDPINRWPEKCDFCTFPDIEHVPQPYLLGRGIDRPVDLAIASLGNFLVRDWPRRVIALACPGQCTFYPTTDKASRQPAPWYLAVPVHRIACGRVRAEVPRCPRCGEPRTAHVNDFEFASPRTMASDIARSAGWFGTEATIGEAEGWARLAKVGIQRPRGGSEQGWSRKRIYRSLFFSLRLELLLKKLKIKGMTRCAGDVGTPGADDRSWVAEQMDRLKGSGPEHAAPSPPRKARGGLERDPRGLGQPGKHGHDFGAVEIRLGRPLPPSYKAFIERGGSMTFHDVEQEEGFEARILPPQDLDTRSFRRGAARFEDEDSRRVDGVLFAATGHGDAFCFDVAADGPEYPVYLYDHELNVFEPYAADFEACLRRFVGGGG